MERIKEGKPITNKKPLELGELKESIVNFTIPIRKELRHNIKKIALDRGIGALEMVEELLEKEFGK